MGTLQSMLIYFESVEPLLNELQVRKEKRRNMAHQPSE